MVSSFKRKPTAVARKSSVKPPTPRTTHRKPPTVVVLPSSFDRRVFVNCPFDEDYIHFLHALIFTVHQCGFSSQTAADETGSHETRLQKIVRLIQQSRLSVHDMSRLSLDPKSQLPRFNMPFECGLAFGITKTTHEERSLLVVCSEPYKDKVALSDLAGMDPGYYQNSELKLIEHMRRFLASNDKSGSLKKGASEIHTRLNDCRAWMPKYLKAQKVGISAKEIASLKYLTEWRILTVEWLLLHPT